MLANANYGNHITIKMHPVNTVVQLELTQCCMSDITHFHCT